MKVLTTAYADTDRVFRRFNVSTASNSTTTTKSEFVRLRISTRLGLRTRDGANLKLIRENN
jgi:hypothetical protein